MHAHKNKSGSFTFEVNKKLTMKEQQKQVIVGSSIAYSFNGVGSIT